MDKATEELNRCSHILLDAEVRLRTINVQVQQFEKEIALLTVVEANLVENIRVLKKKHVIVTSGEYKKAITDLGTARTRIAFLRMDLESYLKIEKNCEVLYEEAKADYEKAFNLINNPPNNVVKVDFGRKND